ncbi:MAG: MlaD family protein [Solirubrobacterales bacterium]
MRRQGVADNPVLVGAGAILVILVMVLLSYNANSGLPFVPTYDITADIPNGAALVKGNEVRIGGARVGTVTSIKPESKDDVYYAQIALKLDKNIGPIPENSTVEVRPKSTIGLKYVELTLGDSDDTIPNGGNLPISQATTATEFEDLLDTFDKRVREGNKRSLQEFGNAFAGRGADLNTAFGELGPLFENLEPVAKTIADPATRLGEFIRVIAQVAHDYAASGEAGYEVWVNADRTFAAFAQASNGIQQSLEESPATLAVLTENFPAERKYFRQLTDTVERFQEGAPYLPTVATDFASITDDGPSAFNKLYKTVPAFNTTLTNLGQFAADSQVKLGLNALKNFVVTIKQPLEYITPAQTKCNYFGLLVRNLASTVSSRDNGVGMLRFGAVAGFPNINGDTSAESGPGDRLPASSQNAYYQNGRLIGDVWNYLNSNGYPGTGQNGICGAGNEFTKGVNQGGTIPQSLPKQTRTTEPDGIKPGFTTQNTQPIGSDQVDTK